MPSGWHAHVSCRHQSGEEELSLVEMPAVRWETHERGGFARLGTAEDRRLGPPEPPLRGLPSHWFVVCRQSLPRDLLRSWFAQIRLRTRCFIGGQILASDRVIEGQAIHIIKDLPAQNYILDRIDIEAVQLYTLYVDTQKY